MGYVRGWRSVRLNDLLGVGLTSMEQLYKWFPIICRSVEFIPFKKPPIGSSISSARAITFSVCPSAKDAQCTRVEPPRTRP